MLKNENLNVEVRTIIRNSGVTGADIAREMGTTRQAIISIYRKKMLDGNEAWIRALDACGYDVEVRIKKRKE